MLIKRLSRHQESDNLKLAATTAIAAGMVNVASLIAFFSFTSNVTGHMAIFAEEISKGHMHQVSIVFLWLTSFLTGAFFSNFIINSFKKKRVIIGHATPIFLEILLLFGVGYYGNEFYNESLQETEYLTAVLLLSMGLQNGMVSTVSDGVVKTTHVTGLFTDLGTELSRFILGESSSTLRGKILLRVVIAGFYLGGGIVGGFVYLNYGFHVFYVAAAVLVVVFIHDYTVISRGWKGSHGKRFSIQDRKELLR